jgi:hypothetical protein
MSRPNYMITQKLKLNIQNIVTRVRKCLRGVLSKDKVVAEVTNRGWCGTHYKDGWHLKKEKR